MNPPKILVIEDDDEERETIVSALIEAGYKTTSCNCVEDAYSLISLIDKILISLFKKMGYLGVQKNAFHGPGEHGKDILPFYKYGDFNERIYYAAQVKTRKISAQSGARSNIHILLDQVRSVLLFSFIY